MRAGERGLRKFREPRHDPAPGDLFRTVTVDARRRGNGQAPDWRTDRESPDPLSGAPRHRKNVSRLRLLWLDLRGWLSSLAAVTIAVSGIGILSPAVAAHAAEIPGAIANVRTSATEVEHGQSFRLDFDWVVPDHTPSGDTFSLELPPELENANTAKISLLAPGGEIVAEGVWSGRTAVFTLKEYVDAHPFSISGSGWFLARLDRDAVGEEGGQVTTTVAGTTITVTLVVPEPGDGGGTPVDPEPQEPTERDAYKWAYWSRDDQDTIEPEGSIRWVMSTPAYDRDVARITVVDEVEAAAGWQFHCDGMRSQYRKEHPNSYWGGAFDLVSPVPAGTPYLTTFSYTPTRVEAVFEEVPAYDLLRARPRRRRRRHDAHRVRELVHHDDRRRQQRGRHHAAAPGGGRRRLGHPRLAAAPAEDRRGRRARGRPRHVPHRRDVRRAG